MRHGLCVQMPLAMSISRLPEVALAPFLLGRPLGYLIFSLIALIGDPIAFFFFFF